MSATSTPIVERQAIPAPLLLVTFLISLPLGTMDFLLPLYGRAVAASELEIGALFSVAALLGLALRPLTGALADRGHAGALLAFGVVWYVLAMVGYAVATSYTMLLAARVAQSLGAVAVFVALYVLLADSTAEEQRGGAFGRLTSVTFLAFLAGGVLAGLVLLHDRETQHELRGALDALGVHLPLPDPIDRLPALHLLYAAHAGGAALALAPALLLRRSPAAPLSAKLDSRPAGPTALLRSRSSAVLRLLLVGLLLGLGYNLATPMLPLLLQDRFGPGLAALAIAYVIPGLLYAALPGPLGRRADRWGLPRAAAAGMLARSVVYTLLPLSPTLYLVALLWSVEATGYSLSSPALQGLLSRATAPKLRGSLYGLYGLAAGIGSIVGGPVGGWLYRQVGAAVPFWGHAALLILAALLIPGATRRRRDTAAPPPPP